MGKQSIDDDLKAISPSCMWGLMNAVDYHHWRYSVLKRMLPYKGNHVKHVKGYQIPKYDYEEQQETLLQEEEKKKNLQVDFVTKKKGSTKKRSIKSRLKGLLANHKTKEGKGKQKQPTKYSSRRGSLQRTYSIHHLEFQNHDHPAEKWDHPIIFIPGKKDVKNDEESSDDMKKVKENDEFANVLEILKVDKRMFLEIMKNSKDGIRKLQSPSKPKAKLLKSGSFPGTRFSSYKPSKLKDKQSVLKWERFPDSFRENIEGVKLGKALSLILATTNGSDQDEDKETDQERRHGAKFDEVSNAFSHKRSVSLNESIDKYVGLFENNNFKKEVKLPQSRSLKLRNEDEINPRLFSKIGSLSSIVFQYEEPDFAEWPDMSSYSTNVDFKVEENAMSLSEDIQQVKLEKSTDHTFEKEDLASFRAGSFTGGECSSSARVEDEGNTCCPEKNTSISDEKADELSQESCFMRVPESCFEDGDGDGDADGDGDGAATIDDVQYVQGVENKCDDIDEDSSFNNKKNLDNFLLPGNIDHNYQAEIEYIKHILEFSGFNKNPSQFSDQQQPLKPCLFDDACRPEDLERFTEDLRTFYYYQLLFDLINEELVRLNERLSTYYPKPLSYSCHVHVFPVGDRVVETVCSDIGKLLDFKPEEIVSLDSIIDFDLKKDEENWMNLQWESESVALEVDHMIFEDLLKELVC